MPEMRTLPLLLLLLLAVVCTAQEVKIGYNSAPPRMEQAAEEFFAQEGKQQHHTYTSGCSCYIL